jgi:hypothetical protein
LRQGKGQCGSGADACADNHEKSGAAKASEAVEYDDDNLKAAPAQDFGSHEGEENHKLHIAGEHRVIDRKAEQNDQRQRQERACGKACAISPDQQWLDGRNPVERRHEAEGQHPRDHDAGGRRGGKQAKLGNGQSVGNADEIDERQDKPARRPARHRDIGVNDAGVACIEGLGEIDHERRPDVLLRF